MKNILNQFFIRYPNLENIGSPIQQAAKIIIETFQNGGKFLICGNGGSCADSDHIVGELMKGFVMKRHLDFSLQKKLGEISPERGKVLAEKLQQGFPAISLSAHSALITAISNDMGGSFIFAQQVLGYGIPGDVLMAISTSGNSQNVLDALIIAKAKGLKTIGMTGKNNEKMKNFCDVLINVQETNTANIQELQLPIYHTICMLIENFFFKE